jgi:hypothetical protein
MEPAAEFAFEPLPPIDESATFGLPDGMLAGSVIWPVLTRG